MTLEQKHIDQLYTLLRKLEAKHDNENAATLRWAIFELERHIESEETSG